MAEDKSIKPDYYKSGANDVIAFCHAHGLSFARGNVIKYVTRAGRKDAGTELQDLRKALEYLQREINHIECRHS